MKKNKVLLPTLFVSSILPAAFSLASCSCGSNPQPVDDSILADQYVPSRDYCNVGYLRSNTYTLETKHKYTVEFRFKNWGGTPVGEKLALAFGIIQPNVPDRAPYPLGDPARIDWDGESLEQIQYADLVNRDGWYCGSWLVARGKVLNNQSTIKFDFEITTPDVEMLPSVYIACWTFDLRPLEQK